MVVSNIGARIATKLGARTLIALGTLVLGAGMLLFLRTAPASDYVTVLIPAMLVTGVGVGLAFVSVTMAATAGVPNRDQGIASGLSATAQSQLLLARCGPLLPPDCVEEWMAGR